MNPVEALEPPIVEETRRNYSGWLALALLLVLTMAAALDSSLQREAHKKVLTHVATSATRHSSPASGAVLAILLIGSIVLWNVYLRRAIMGTLPSPGLPLNSISKFDADRLAIRAAQIFALFMLLQTLAGALPKHSVNLGFRTLLVSIGLFGGIWALQRVPVDGKQITLKMLGVNGENFGRNLGLGFLAFVAEFPVAVYLGYLGATLFSFLPKPTHPASEALAKDHSLATVLPIIILGSVLAPFWEELVFRGLIFPGLKRLIGGIVPALLLSSFLFAAMHPQGIPIWFSLAGVGAMSCFVSYQSKSLVPSMVMHCLHNLAVFALGFLAS